MISLATFAMMERRHYKKWHIPKANGRGFRIIHEPDAILKKKQQEMLQNEYRTGVGPGPYAHAFVRGRSAKTNALVHLGNDVIVRMDIKDFFPSVTPEHVIRCWEKMEGLLPYEIESRTQEFGDIDLSRLVPPNGLIQCAFIPSTTDLLSPGLPQGGCLSGYLSNLAMKPIDYMIAALLKRHIPDSKNPRYSRYADDLTLSSKDSSVLVFVKIVSKILAKHRFRINWEKFMVMRKKSGRQVVTGVVVNSYPRVPREMRKMIRGRIKRLIMKAATGHDEKGQPVSWDEIKEEHKSLRGHLAYSGGIDEKFAARYRPRLDAVGALLEAHGV